MGKRKERRLAALSGAGRRVKLDLFAEPSGDLGGSSVHDEVEGDTDPNSRAGVPRSSSTSGQLEENPLLLLGQYSDEELDEGNKKPNHDATESSLITHTGQVEEAVVTECEELVGNASKEVASHQVNEEDVGNDFAQPDAAIDMGSADTVETNVATSGDPGNQADSGAQVSDSGSSGIQVVGDVTSGWKIVMHEESNKYYYWNIETGETSWEVPDVLTQGTEMASEQKVPVVNEVKESSHVDNCASNPNFTQLNVFSNVTAGDEPNDSKLIPEFMEKHELGLEMDNWNERYKDQSLDDLKLGAKVEQTESDDGSGKVTAPCQEMSSLCGYSKEQSTFSISGLKDQITGINEHQENYEAGRALSSDLVKYGESLLQRLKAVEGYKDKPEGRDWLSKYILEVEIRLSDFKSLLAYGPSLLPFWLHSEGQLKRIECAIDNELSQFVKSEQLHEAENVQSMGDCRLDEKEDVIISNSENPQILPAVDMLKVVNKESHDRSADDLGNAEETLLTQSSTQHLGSKAEGNLEKANGTKLLDISISKTGPHTGEDVDMDVDMDVDDETHADNTTSGYALNAKSLPRTDQQIQPTIPAEYFSVPEVESTAQTSSVEIFTESRNSSVPSTMVESDVSAVGHENETVILQVPPTLATTENKVANDGGPATSGTVASVAQSATVSKVQSKVLRGKKRTVAVAPTLRSNKKVSSLVDKWKAAKEELYEDEEDEPQNAYELLERKRQKEIEEWRAQQIATGEARDNANFQPLGGDWRERVRRKRAQSTREAVEAAPEVSVKEKQQPDLIELSRDLPSGWQAYWDESSKEVYYGNTVTSETTWTKPTR
ncbi:uncharacterized protein LOC122639691 isoform X2 [Telopea speciosissima]|uniref:uncharacterized protein LOC122639691 isoform X2 n=1 Tax=Telopea speciosissima TaxID=54955 RepID=UPI001CC5BF31|nr:uncharacterized protein LOC122639691 isoform X2 [Telopea speciosissima]